MFMQTKRKSFLQTFRTTSREIKFQSNRRIKSAIKREKNIKHMFKQLVLHRIYKGCCIFYLNIHVGKWGKENVETLSFIRNSLKRFCTVLLRRNSNANLGWISKFCFSLFATQYFHVFYNILSVFPPEFFLLHFFSVSLVNRPCANSNRLQYTIDEYKIQCDLRRFAFGNNFLPARPNLTESNASDR